MLNPWWPDLFQRVALGPHSGSVPTCVVRGDFIVPPDHGLSFYVAGQAGAINNLSGGTLLFSRKWYTFHSH